MATPDTPRRAPRFAAWWDSGICHICCHGNKRPTAADAVSLLSFWLGIRFPGAGSAYPFSGSYRPLTPKLNAVPASKTDIPKK